jgi:hypothetical protein
LTSRCCEYPPTQLSPNSRGRHSHLLPASDPANLPPIPFTPTAYDFETFSTTFEDPFSYPARPFEPPTGGVGLTSLDPADAYHHPRLDGTASAHANLDDDEDDDAAALDNKLLGFGAPIPSGKATLLTDAGQFAADPHMTGELYGMFFVAEDVFGADSNTTGRPLELTCYRRNLWQISGQITLPRHVALFVDEQGRRAQVAELAASVTAVESIEGRVAEMITIPWRGSNAPLGAEETKVVSAPPVVPLDFGGGGQEVDGGSRVSVPVAWKRLQFKHATANNGRRKGLQQHYVVQINLLVKAKGGEYVKVAEIQSGPVIVRGRSPRNFDSRKEVPLGDKRPLERKSTEGSKQQKQDEGDLAKMQRYGSLGNVQVCLIRGNTPFSRRILTPTQQSPSDWTTPYASSTPHPQHASKKLAISSPSLNRPPVPSWGALDASPIHQKHNKPTAKPRTSSTTGPQPLPLNLSLSEDERSPPNRSNSNDSAQSPSLTKSSMLLSTTGTGLTGQGGQTHLSSHNPLASPLETEDMLYEYFPLSLDDW